MSLPVQLLALLAIVLIYLALGIAWARVTPAWDNPDEPAHWNYIVHLASGQSLPILRRGDDAQQLVDRLKSARFPPGSDISTILYESHQPPLYYVAGAVLHNLTSGLALKQQVDALRALSLVFGVGTIVGAWWFARLLLPGETVLALGTAAFVAFVPMHINLTAAINNDALGDMLITLTVVLLLRWVQKGAGWRFSILLGVMIGLAVLTKVTTLVVLPLAALAAILRWWTAGRHTTTPELNAVTALLLSIGCAVLIAGWWVVRNMLTYGVGDPLALGINQAVVAQPLTGPLNTAAMQRFASITFNSFWAQFGWMGIPVPQVYPVLTLLSALAGAGVVAALIRGLRTLPGQLRRQQVASMVLAACWPLAVFGADAQYNLTFIQAQGRYLFPAIGGIGFFFMLGVSRLAGPRLAGPAIALTALSLAVLSATLLPTVVIPAWK
jgi:4-amino-4-deoxy-L-arabinose transferase-like glycosyltransferase